VTSWPTAREEPGDVWPAGQPLSAIRVLDFSMFLPGPFCTQILADLGADVIKVEPPGSDPSRQLRDGMYSVANRNKRGVVVDLKQPAGREAALALASKADVIVEGFRPGVADRLGIGYTDIARVAPGAVYCSITGYGQTGPDSGKAGHDLTFLAASGALSVSPHWGEPPRRSGVPVADLAASSYATISILVALRERDRTGRGSRLDVAITDAALAFISPRCGPSFSSPPDSAAYPANDVFDTADGARLAVAAVEEHFWRNLVAVLRAEAPELAEARFATPQERHRHGDELAALLRLVFRRRTLAHWLDAFAGVDVPVEPVISARAAADRTQVRRRGIVQSCAGEEQVVFPVLRDGLPLGRFRSSAPEAGQHDGILSVASAPEGPSHDQAGERCQDKAV
jgi:crotonobetainyl-CoA:carnitine CoA-transferase CaiB-like acyl-CoA transferase